MKRKLFMEEQIIRILREADAGAVMLDLRRMHGMSSAIYADQHDTLIGFVARLSAGAHSARGTKRGALPLPVRCYRDQVETERAEAVEQQHDAARGAGQGLQAGAVHDLGQENLRSCQSTTARLKVSPPVLHKAFNGSLDPEANVHAAFSARQLLPLFTCQFLLERR